MRNLLLMLAAIKRIQLKKTELQPTRVQLAYIEISNDRKIIMNTCTIAAMACLFPYEQN